MPNEGKWHRNSTSHDQNMYWMYHHINRGNSWCWKKQENIIYFIIPRGHASAKNLTVAAQLPKPRDNVWGQLLCTKQSVTFPCMILYLSGDLALSNVSPSDFVLLMSDTMMDSHSGLCQISFRYLTCHSFLF